MSETTQQLIDRLPTAIDITYRDGNGGISLSAIINELAARLKVAEEALECVDNHHKGCDYYYAKRVREALQVVDLSKPFNGE